MSFAPYRAIANMIALPLETQGSRPITFFASLSGWIPAGTAPSVAPVLLPRAIGAVRPPLLRLRRGRGLGVGGVIHRLVRHRVGGLRLGDVADIVRGIVEHRGSGGTALIGGIVEVVGGRLAGRLRSAGREQQQDGGSHGGF